jgi:hypothetical protein
MVMQKKISCLLLFALIFPFTFISCKKHKNDAPVDPLPPASQTGANTLGFLLNGQPWTPKGWNGSTINLSVSVDNSYKNGTFNITAYRILSNSVKEYFALGIADSLNFQHIPVKIQIGKPLFGLLYSNSTCTYDTFNDSMVYKTGELVLSKYDKVNRIISGTFVATFFKSGCGDTIKITNGRFDMQF